LPAMGEEETRNYSHKSADRRLPQARTAGGSSLDPD
jgi:hypothetical protein